MKTRELKVFPDMVGRFRRVGHAMIADNAVVLGDVRLGKDANVWFGVTIRGDDCWIESEHDDSLRLVVGRLDGHDPPLLAEVGRL